MSILKVHKKHKLLLLRSLNSSFYLHICKFLSVRQTRFIAFQESDGEGWHILDKVHTSTLTINWSIKGEVNLEVQQHE